MPRSLFKEDQFVHRYIHDLTEPARTIKKGNRRNFIETIDRRHVRGTGFPQPTDRRPFGTA
jgi:hypothetical protein